MYLKKIIASLLCLISMILFCSISPMGAGGNALDFPQFSPDMFGQGGIGSLPEPTPEEMKELMAIIQDLEKNDPEQLKMLEQFGQQMISQLPDEDIKKLLNPLNEFFAQESMDVVITPDEIRAEALKAIAANEAAQQNQEPEYPELSSTAEQEQAPSTIAEQKPSQATINQTQRIIEDLIDIISSIREKSAAIKEVHQVIKSWHQELRDLMFYLKVINNIDHIKKLTLTENKKLLQTLNSLYGELKINEPQIILPEELTENDSPYTLLGVTIHASEKEITRAFEKLAEQNNPDTIDQQFNKETLSKKDLKRKKRQAQLAYEALQDAYEQLSDKKLRAQIDREIAAQNKHNKQNLEQAINALKNITASFAKAFYTEMVTTQLEQFLTKHAPDQIKQKKIMEAAEKKRINEQKQAGKITPTQSPISESNYNNTMPYYNDNNYGYYDDFPTHMSDDYYDSPSYEYGMPDILSNDDNSYNPSQEPASNNKSPDNSNNKSQEEPFFSTGPTKTKTQNIRDLATLIEDITTNLKKIDRTYNDPAMQNFLKNLDTYMHEPSYEAITKKTPSNQTKKEIAEPKMIAELQSLSEKFMLNELEKDITELKKLMRTELTKPTEEIRDAWFNLEDIRDASETALEKTITMLNSSMIDRENRPTNLVKKDAHTPQITELAKLTNKIFTTLKKYDEKFEIDLEPKDNKEPNKSNPTKA